MQMKFDKKYIVKKHKKINPNTEISKVTFFYV